MEVEEEGRSLSISDSGSTDIARVSTEIRIKKMLDMLRISAVIQKISGWGGRGRIRGDLITRDEGGDGPSNVARSYILEANHLVMEHSDRTAAIFMYLPAPPGASSWEEEMVYKQWLQLLTELTVDLPPTVLVHGISAVTSTTL